MFFDKVEDGEINDSKKRETILKKENVKAKKPKTVKKNKKNVSLQM